jgi:hypothetical protein
MPARSQCNCTVCQPGLPGKSFGLAGVKGSGETRRGGDGGSEKALTSWGHLTTWITCTPRRNCLRPCHGRTSKQSPQSQTAAVWTVTDLWTGLVQRIGARRFTKIKNPHNPTSGISIAQSVMRPCAVYVYCLECHKGFTIKMIPGAGK